MEAVKLAVSSGITFALPTLFRLLPKKLNE
jgi:hypothetical protein